MQPTDIVIKCKTCSKSFRFAANQQTYNRERGWKPPEKCPECRRSPTQQGLKPLESNVQHGGNLCSASQKHSGHDQGGLSRHRKVLNNATGPRFPSAQQQLPFGNAPPALLGAEPAAQRPPPRTAGPGHQQQVQGSSRGGCAATTTWPRGLILLDAEQNVYMSETALTNRLARQGVPFQILSHFRGGTNQKIQFRDDFAASLAAAESIGFLQYDQDAPQLLDGIDAMPKHADLSALTPNSHTAGPIVLTIDPGRTQVTEDGFTCRGFNEQNENTPDDISEFPNWIALDSYLITPFTGDALKNKKKMADAFAAVQKEPHKFDNSWDPAEGYAPRLQKGGGLQLGQQNSALLVRTWYKRGENNLYDRITQQVTQNIKVEVSCKLSEEYFFQNFAGQFTTVLSPVVQRILKLLVKTWQRSESQTFSESADRCKVSIVKDGRNVRLDFAPEYQGTLRRIVEYPRKRLTDGAEEILAQKYAGRSLQTEKKTNLQYSLQRPLQRKEWEACVVLVYLNCEVRFKGSLPSEEGEEEVGIFSCVLALARCSRFKVQPGGPLRKLPSYFFHYLLLTPLTQDEVQQGLNELNRLNDTLQEKKLEESKVSEEEEKGEGSPSNVPVDLSLRLYPKPLALWNSDPSQTDSKQRSVAIDAPALLALLSEKEKARLLSLKPQQQEQ